MRGIMTAFLAGVELGGTKGIAVLADGREIVARAAVPTTDPVATLASLRAILDGWRAEERAPVALGIACFGPVGLNPSQPDYGHILKTTKPGWSGADVLGSLAGSVDGPATIHTDVTAAALAEGRWGAARGCSDHIYITIGTGIGGGIVAGGRPVEGLMHPEIGHTRVRRQAGDSFAGVCPFHGDCLEGVASGPAIAARADRPAKEIGHDDPLWALIAGDVAEAVATLMLTLAPQRIVFGGGVGVGQPQLLPLVRRGIGERLAGYLPFGDAASLETIIVPAALGEDAGPLGAIALAMDALALA